MSQSSEGKAKAVAIGLAGLAGLIMIAALVAGGSKFDLSTLTFVLIGLALVFEGLSAPLVHAGYISLASPLYLIAILSKSDAAPLEALSYALMVALVPSLIRLGFPAQAYFSTRLAYFGLSIIRVTLFGGILAFVPSVLSDTPGAVLIAAGGAALAWLAFDKFLVSVLVQMLEEPADQRTWNNVLDRSLLILPLPLVIALIGVKLQMPGPEFGVFLASLTIFAFRGTLRYSIDELVVREQEELELKLKSAQHTVNALKEEKQQLESEGKRTSQELGYVYEMAAQIGASTQLEETIGIVLSMIRRLRIPYQSCVILLYRNGQLTPVLSETPYKELLAMSHLLQLEETLISRVVENQKPRLESEMSASSEGRIFKDERSVMCVPLVVGKEIVGVIYVGSVRPGTHREEHLDTLKMLAAFAAPSVKTAMLFDEKQTEVEEERRMRKLVEAKNRQLAGLQKMGQQMGENLRMANTMDVVANSLKTMIPDAQSVIMFTQDSNSADKHAVKAAFTMTPYADYVKNLSLRDDEGLLGKAIQSRSTLLVPDTAAYDVHNLLAFERSVVIAPLMAAGSEEEEETGHEVLGCLYVGASKEKAFTEEHRSLIQTVSYQTAMALKNVRLYEQTQKMALTDGLTGLYTHRLFQEKLAQEIEWSERHNRPFCLVMVDTDNFKTYNDTLGHPAGDSLLKEIALLLKDKVRSTDIVCRYGGDEFALLLKETGKDAALKMCERIREAFQLRFGGNQVQVTASIGMACFPTDAKTKKDLAKAADDALYVSKRGGRNRVSASPPLEEREANPIVQEVLPRG